MEKLVGFCIEKNIAKLNLEVCSINTVAISLYKKWGFVQVGCRKKYFHFLVDMFPQYTLKNHEYIHTILKLLQDYISVKHWYN